MPQGKQVLNRKYEFESAVSAMEAETSNRRKTSLFRSSAIGAALLAIITLPGTCFYLYQWISTGNLLHLGEAAALFFVASLMGASGGAAYHVVAHSRIKSPWKPLLVAVATVEAYLLAFSLLALVIEQVAPKLNEGIPLGDVRFFLVVHGYGLFLCMVAFGFSHAPRATQIILGGLLLVFIILLAFVMCSLLFITPEQLDLWMSFLKPLGVACWTILSAVVLVAFIGWARFFQKMRNKKHIQ